jgi:hypothetical protein
MLTDPDPEHSWLKCKCLEVLAFRRPFSMMKHVCDSFVAVVRRCAALWIFSSLCPCSGKLTPLQLFSHFPVFYHLLRDHTWRFQRPLHFLPTQGARGGQRCGQRKVSGKGGFLGAWCYLIVFEPALNVKVQLPWRIATRTPPRAARALDGVTGLIKPGARGCVVRGPHLSLDWSRAPDESPLAPLWCLVAYGFLFVIFLAAFVETHSTYICLHISRLSSTFSFHNCLGLINFTLKKPDHR